MTSPIFHKNLSETVAEVLQEQITSGVYQLDQKLPIEPELMKEFGVGRSTIREAIRKLENFGMVRVQQGLGTFVTAQKAIAEPLAKRLLTADEADLKEVRELLEIKIVEKAALNRTLKDIAHMKACLAKRNNTADTGDLQQWVESDINFHLAIADACKNTILTELYRTFAEHQLKRSITETYSHNISRHRLTSLHELLLENIIEKKPAKAIKAIEAMQKEQ